MHGGRKNISFIEKAGVMPAFCVDRCICILYNEGIFGTLPQILQKERGIFMKSYVCSLCGYVYNPAEGCPEFEIEPGTVWADVPEDFVCPMCGASKDQFFEE